jgi:cobyrinic acid a,c-diamide synthase
VIVDAAGLATCRWPSRPRKADGLVLDRVRDETHLARLTTELEALWGIPVLGALEDLPELRSQVCGLPEGARPPKPLRYALGRAFRRFGFPDRMLALAVGRELPYSAAQPDVHPFPSHISVAVAYDDAFNCYFPDTLDGLESYGATIHDFSPLRDDRLPGDVDVVYLGCGHPERFAAALAQNHCMKLALRSHMHRGGRIYAEGGGLAYLCQEMETAHVGRQRMVGVFPAVARHRAPVAGPTPAEVMLNRPTWLGAPGTVVRGYYNSAWDLEPAGPLAGCVAPPRPNDLVGVSRAVGSRLHVHFASQPELLPGFFRPAGA